MSDKSFVIICGIAVVITIIGTIIGASIGFGAISGAGLLVFFSCFALGLLMITVAGLFELCKSKRNGVEIQASKTFIKDIDIFSGQINPINLSL